MNFIGFFWNDNEKKILGKAKVCLGMKYDRNRFRQ